MKETYTPMDLMIRNLYKETTVAEVRALGRILESDDYLREEYLELRSAYRQLPKVLFSPSSDVLSHIMEYSSKSSFERAH